jgi:DNA topoisomerase-3
MKTTALVAKKSKRKKKTTPMARPTTASAKDSRVEDALRTWRLREAKRRGVPAFNIFSDKVLTAIASARPGTARELLAIHGIGMHTVEKYGAHIFRILHEGN